MKKTLLLIVVILMLLLAFSISSSAEEYTDSLTITEAEAEFFELTDEERAKFNPQKPKGFKTYHINGDAIELFSYGGSINDILTRSLDEKDYIKDLRILTAVETKNYGICKSYDSIDNKFYTSTYTLDYFIWRQKNYVLYTDRIPQLDGLNISNIYYITSDHPLGGTESIIYYVTDKGDYVALFGFSSYKYFMPASALIDCAKKHMEDRAKYGISNRNMAFSLGPGSAVIREYLINPKTPDVTPTPTPDVEITPTPTPTPMPTPIPEVTPTPTPTPSVTITPSSKPTDKTTPIPTPTISLSETIAPLTETAPAVTPAPTLVEEPKSPFLWISLGGAVLIVLAVVILVKRCKK